MQEQFILHGMKTGRENLNRGGDTAVPEAHPYETPSPTLAPDCRPDLIPGTFILAPVLTL